MRLHEPQPLVDAARDLREEIGGVLSPSLSATVLAAFGKLARAGIDRADKLGDKDTADLFTEISRGVDKWLWFVEAHLQADR